MESTPKLLKITRQTLAHMGAAKVALDALTGASVTTTGGTIIAARLAHTPVDPWLPTLSFVAGVISLLSRVIIAHYMNVSIIENPLKDDPT